LAGFVQTHLGRIPDVGDTFEGYGHRFTVVEMDGRRVSRVQVAPPTPTPDDSARSAHETVGRVVTPER
jgi:putative hemolysin